MKRKKYMNCVVLSCLDKPTLIYRWFRRKYFSRLIGKERPAEIPFRLPS